MPDNKTKVLANIVGFRKSTPAEFLMDNRFHKLKKSVLLLCLDYTGQGSSLKVIRTVNISLLVWKTFPDFKTSLWHFLRRHYLHFNGWMTFSFLTCDTLAVLFCQSQKTYASRIFMPVNTYWNKKKHPIIRRRLSPSIAEISPIFSECLGTSNCFHSEAKPFLKTNLNASTFFSYGSLCIKMKMYSFVLLTNCPFGNSSWISSTHILSGLNKYLWANLEKKGNVSRWRGSSERESRTLHYLTISFTALAQTDKCAGSQKVMAKQIFWQSGSPPFGSRRTLRISWKLKNQSFTDPCVILNRYGFFLFGGTQITVNWHWHSCFKKNGKAPYYNLHTIFQAFWSQTIA